MAKRPTCSINGCLKPKKSRGWCDTHYARWRRTGKPAHGVEGPDRTTQKCTVAGCQNAALNKGLCNKHYIRLLKHGDVSTCKINVFKRGEPISFLKEVVIPYQGDDCLEWPYANNGVGYGLVAINRKNKLVTRVACEAVNGPPPSRKHEAAHSCGNGHRKCCNPKHLYWATHQENILERVKHGTDTRGEKCATSKLTEADVRKIRELGETMSHPKIAEMFPISKGQVQRIMSRKQWGWLD